MAIDIFPGAKLMQLIEWGYPMGQRRFVPAANKAFSVIHITGNSRLPSGENEATWRISDAGLQNSATFFVNRDGSIVQTLGDPLHMAPWANGDLNAPDRSNPRIDALVRDNVNPNKRTIVAIENVGYEPGSSITEAQKRANAKIIRYYHDKAGVPINRQTVIGHYQINSVSRPNCPGKDKSVVDEIVALAQEGGTATGGDMATNWKEVAEHRLKRIKALEKRRDSLVAQLDALEAEIVASADVIAQNEELTQAVNRLRRRINDVKSAVAALAVDVENI